MVLEYDGSRYCGWQSQPEGCSIQDVLETALSRIAQEEIRIITAGRTDSGVHALYQVVHFDTAAQRLLESMFEKRLISLSEFNKITMLNRQSFSPALASIMPENR